MSNGANELVAAVKRDWRSAPLSDADRVMLSYAEKLTLNPSAMAQSDLDGLLFFFKQKTAYDIVLIASLFNFIDRIADAFGVQLDAFTQHMASVSPEGEALPELAASRRSR